MIPDLNAAELLLKEAKENVEIARLNLASTSGVVQLLREAHSCSPNTLREYFCLLERVASATDRRVVSEGLHSCEALFRNGFQRGGLEDLLMERYLREIHRAFCVWVVTKFSGNLHDRALLVSLRRYIEGVGPMFPHNHGETEIPGP